MSISEENTACDGSDYACTPDKKAVLQCKAKQWSKVKDCSGAKGCDASGTKILCDEEEEGAPAVQDEKDEESATDETE